MIKFKRRKFRQPRIEITPVIDMVFILLVFFMLGATFYKPVINMTLPVAASKEVALVNSLKIIITKDKELFLNGDNILIDDLSEKISIYKTGNPELSIIFSGDKNIEYGSFVNIMDILKSSGISKISLEHD